MKQKKPRILLFDIETAPNVVYTWGVWEQNAIDIIEDGYILCFSAKWLDDKKVISRGLINFKGTEENKRKALIKEIWDLFDEADIIIAHNGDQFDIKKVQTQFLLYGMKSPSPFKTIDTKKVAKRYFRFDSNKLDSLGRELGIGQKLDTGGFETWKGCMVGDKKAYRKMMKYNVMDVILLENIYLKLRPYMVNHPNWNIFTDERGNCPNCGGCKLQRRGMVKNLKSVSQRFQCQDCGAWSHSKIEKK